MTRWTKGPLEYERFRKALEVLAAGQGAKGVSVQLQDKSVLHGVVGSMRSANNAASTRNAVPTELSGSVVLHTDDGDVEIDIADIDTAMAH